MKNKRSKSKKVSVTKQHLSSVLKNKNDHQKLIARFHCLNKQKVEIQQKIHSVQPTNVFEKEAILIENNYKKRLEDIEQELNDLGGLVVYQKASIVGEKRFNSSSYFLNSMGGCLKKLRKDLNRPLQLLDVGALGENYVKERSWIHTTAIDLHPTCTFVKQADFFDLPQANSSEKVNHGTEITIPAGGFDIIALSLVINFVGDPTKRGEMIQKAYHLLQKKLPLTGDNLDLLSSGEGFGGLLYVVVPRPCVDNSRYLDQTQYLKIFESCGFHLITSKYSTKLAFHIFYRRSSDMKASTIKFPKKKLRDGPSLNNFSIII